MEFIGLWFIGAVVVGVMAAAFGRTGFGWFLLACLFSPLLMGFLVLVLPRVGATAAKDELGQLITPNTHVRCPDCRELVRKDARKCKHCGSVLVPQ